MKRVLALSLLMVGVISIPLRAQQAFAADPNAPRLEIALGYTAIRANAPPGGDCGCFWMNGGSAQIVLNNRHGFGAVIDFGMTAASNIGSNSGHNITLATILAGPRYTLRRWSRVTPYAQTLFGVGHGSTNNALDDGGTSFAFSSGGGLDLPFRPHFAWRIAQAEYLLTRLPNAVNDRQNQIRLTTGLVFAFR